MFCSCHVKIMEKKRVCIDSAGNWWQSGQMHGASLWRCQVKSLLLRSCLMFLLVDKKNCWERSRDEGNRPSPTELSGPAALTRTMVNDGRCRRAGPFLLSPTLLGLGSGRFLCGWVTSCLGLLVFRAGFAASLWTSTAVVLTGTPLAWLLVLTAFAALVLLVLLAVPHRSGTRWTPAVQKALLYLCVAYDCDSSPMWVLDCGTSFSWHTWVWTVVGSLCSTALLVCCPVLDLPGCRHLRLPEGQGQNLHL